MKWKGRAGNLGRNLFVIIATSFQRNEILINRAVLSVYKQKYVCPDKIKIIIIDDNYHIENINEIKFRVIELRKKLNLQLPDFETIVLPNNRTRHRSGTGAWNTGLFYVKENYFIENSFIAILDDDDEYLPDYLKTCSESVSETATTITGAVFCRIIWRSEHIDIIHNLTQNLLTREEFFIGNPGIQGSNIFINTKLLLDINGFNENYPNTTDRELMIRLLDFVENNKEKIELKVIEKPLVIHYNHQNTRVNTNFTEKKKGLDLFYRDFKKRFSESDFQKSLKRAKKLFNYTYEPPSEL